MKTTCLLRITAASFAVAVWSSGCSSSDAPARRSGRSQEGRRPQITFEQLDRNGDGKVPRDEYAGPPRAFERMDANSDGILTREEFDAGFSRPRRGGQPR